ncbi:MAG: DNA polymerase domain-containing protein, partial [Desulfobaccales bacterium]
WLSRSYPARGRDLWTGEEIPVLALEARAYGLLFRLRHWLGTLPAEVECYNCDLDVASYYLYARRLYPCAWYHLEAGEGGRLRRLDPLEEAFALEFSPPPFLTTLTLSLTRDPLISLDAGNGLALGWEGRTLELTAPDRPGLLNELARLLTRLDPDLVLSDGGDETIIPTLSRWSRETGTPLPLDRERRPVDRKFGAPRSYFSYGRIVYQGAAVPFYGRWHLDRRNSFYYRESGLAGLRQISRIGQMPLQRAARASPGTLITSMQLSRALADGILIPWRKGEPEGFKTAGQLLTIDKGGLSFMPPPGLYCNVAEVDFASMYPTIMARHNISPETVNCPCCREGAAGVRGSSVRAQLDVVADFPGKVYVEPPPPAVPGVMRQARGGDGVTPPLENSPVPEAGYHLCRRREGLVPRTLRPILALREQLKARAREVGGEAAAPYRERQTALKWMLVTCFGYLGYKNARFGKIEAHEAVTAHGRDKLLTAKEISEAAGFRVLHGLTDCLWLQKDGETDTELRENDLSFGGTGVSPVRRRLSVHGPQMFQLREWQSPPPPFGKGGFRGIFRPAAIPNDSLHTNRYQAELAELCLKISAATGVKLALEGVYRWLCFMPSRQDPKRPVATRYFGVFEDGSLKVRGLACRRRDTPPLVRRAQEDLLARMAGAGTARELAALRPELEALAEGFRQHLREGSVQPRDLVITRVLPQPLADYKVDTPTALAARQLEAAGIHLLPGEQVRYVHAEKRGGPQECRIQAAPFLETLDGYDAQHYLELLERAIEEIMTVYAAQPPAI